MEETMQNIKKVKERIKALFVWRDVTFTSFAEFMSKKYGKNYSQSSLSHKLSRGTISFKEVLEIADILGYDVVFSPRKSWKSWEN